MKEDIGGEFAGLEARLRGAELDSDSRVRYALKARLLAKSRRQERRVPFSAWLVPAFAAAAALLLLWPRGGRAVPASLAAAPGYELADDGYAECGRRGLGDTSSRSRF